MAREVETSICKVFSLLLGPGAQQVSYPDPDPENLKKIERYIANAKEAVCGQADQTLVQNMVVKLDNFVEAHKHAKQILCEYKRQATGANICYLTLLGVKRSDSPLVVSTQLRQLILQLSPNKPVYLTEDEQKYIQKQYNARSTTQIKLSEINKHLQTAAMHSVAKDITDWYKRARAQLRPAAPAAAQPTGAQAHWSSSGPSSGPSSTHQRASPPAGPPTGAPAGQQNWHQPSRPNKRPFGQCDAPPAPYANHVTEHITQTVVGIITNAMLLCKNTTPEVKRLVVNSALHASGYHEVLGRHMEDKARLLVQGIHVQYRNNEQFIYRVITRMMQEAVTRRNAAQDFIANLRKMTQATDEQLAEYARTYMEYSSALTPGERNDYQSARLRLLFKLSDA
jgi:ABC-type transporter MlaC component